MAAKDVGLQQLFGDPLLPGIDDFGRRRRRGDLVAVARLDRITEDDSHDLKKGVTSSGARCRGTESSWSATGPDIANIPSGGAELQWSRYGARVQSGPPAAAAAEVDPRLRLAGPRRVSLE
jgi:hypothetical protein